MLCVKRFKGMELLEISKNHFDGKSNDDLGFDFEYNFKVTVSQKTIFQVKILLQVKVLLHAKL